MSGLGYLIIGPTPLLPVEPYVHACITILRLTLSSVQYYKQISLVLFVQSPLAIYNCNYSHWMWCRSNTKCLFSSSLQKHSVRFTVKQSLKAFVALK